MRQGWNEGSACAREGFDGLRWNEVLSVLELAEVAVSVCRVDASGPARVLVDCNETFVRLSGRQFSELTVPGALDRLQQHGRDLGRMLSLAPGGVSLSGRYRWIGGIEMDFRAVLLHRGGAAMLVSLERPAGVEARLRGRLRLLALRLLSVRSETCGEIRARLDREVAPALRTCHLLHTGGTAARPMEPPQSPAPEAASLPAGGEGPAALVESAWLALDGLLERLRLESAEDEDLAEGLRRLAARHRRDTGAPVHLRLCRGWERLGGLERRVLLYAAAAVLDALRQDPGRVADLRAEGPDLRLNIGARQVSLVIRAPHGDGHDGLHRRLAAAGVEELLELARGGLEVSLTRDSARLRLSLPLPA